MEIYLPRAKVREMRRQVKAEALPDDETLKQKYYRDLWPFERSLIGSFHQFRLQTLYGYMNNFQTLFPNPKFAEGSYQKFIFTQLGIMDITFREYAEKSIASGMHPQAKPEDWNSSLALNQTPREFFQTVDDVIDYYKIPTVEVRALFEQNWGRTRQINQAHRAIFPVYVHLRALGYNRKELAL
jgi:hypothetical protein